MRYKFRAWLKQEKKMVVPYAINFEERVVFFDEKYENVERFERIRIVSFEEIELMQYTGLQDKNGVEIYEGDIVKIYEYDEIVKVAYDEYFVGFVCEYYEEEKCVYKEPLSEYTSIASPHIEVIGNIYKDKELLENE